MQSFLPTSGKFTGVIIWAKQAAMSCAWSLQAAHEDTTGPCRLYLVWSASGEAQEYCSSSQELSLACSLKVVPCSRIDSCACNLWWFLCGQSILRSTAWGCTNSGLHSLGASRVCPQTWSFAGIGLGLRTSANGNLYTSSVDPRWRMVVFMNFASCSLAQPIRACWPHKVKQW